MSALIRLICLFTVSICLLTACGSEQDNAADAERAAQRLQRAELYQQQGQYRAALIEAKNALQAPAVAPRAHLLIAEIYNALGQGKLAKKELESVTDNSQRIVQAHVDALMLQRKYRSAEQYLSENRSLFNADQARYQLMLGKALLRLGETEAAAKALAVAAADNNTRVEAQVAQAELSVAMKKPQQARQQLDQLLAETPEAIDALILKAALAYQERDLDTAEDVLSTALSQLPKTDIITPQRTAVLNNLILILTQQGRSAEALVYSKLIAEENPQGQQLREQFNQALALYRDNNQIEAEKLLLSLYEQTRSDSVGVLLGMIYYDRGELSKAQQYLGQHVDPEVTSKQAVKALAATQLSLNQAGEIASLLDRDDIDAKKDPDLAALLGSAQINAGNSSAGVTQLTQVLQFHPQKNLARVMLARYYADNRDYQRAIALLQEGIQISDDRYLLQTELARVHLRAGQLPEAEEIAAAMVSDRPEQLTGYILLGQSQWSARNLPAALESFRKADQLSPDDPTVLYGMGSVYLAQQKPAAAKPLFARLMELTPDSDQAFKGYLGSLEMSGVSDSDKLQQQLFEQNNSATARAVMAEYYLRRQQLSQALPLVRELQQLPQRNNYVQAVCSQAALIEASEQFRQQAYNQARETILSALNHDPDHLRLNALLISLELQEQRPEEARKLLALLENKVPANVLTTELRGDIATAEQRYADAAKAYRQVWQSRPNDSAANKLYNSLLKTVQAEQAEQFLQQWRQTLPQSAQAITLAAVRAQQAEQPQQAIALYQQVLTLSPDNVIALNNLAWLYHQQQDPRALATAEKAYQLADEIASVVDTYGWLLVQNGQRDKGISMLEQALALAPENPEIAAHLAEARQQ